MPPRLPFLVFCLLQPCLSRISILQAQLTVCRSIQDLQKTVQKDEDQQLVELKSVCPNLIYDLRYASKNNFVRQNMYPARTRTTYLRKQPALALKRVQEELQSSGLGIKIWDAYRPYGVTVAFWELIGDERYVANPAKGSGHNRGIAVDLTLIQTNDGTELDMGTGFDHFSDTAHHQFRALPVHILNNRALLRTIMEKHGFKAYEEEWWHYSWPDSIRYEILDIPFAKLKKQRS
ncbi:MAG: M15 family metallopeptidase [Bacteroidetes bacterium]|nr:M15 family metallopeptidase [Bacteroidota bacterium]